MPKPKLKIRFVYMTGLRRNLFRNVRLSGSWDNEGRSSSHWSTVPMLAFQAEDGCPAYAATVELDDTEKGSAFRWGVLVDGPAGANLWGILTEAEDPLSRERQRTFILTEDGQVERYYLTHCRRLGANKLLLPGDDKPALRFAVWAPHARAVEVVFGDLHNGYIADDGAGATSLPGAFPMSPAGEGVWETDLNASPSLRDFKALVHQPYMYRITRDDGSVRYRTDLHSRGQIGRGQFDPSGRPYQGSRDDLDGTVGCSLVLDPEAVTEVVNEGVWPATRFLQDRDFWANEFHAQNPVPTRVQDLTIYELHVGGLGFGHPGRPGNLEDAIALVDYLQDLGINAVELMPLSEFQGSASWGYTTSHFFAVEYSAGGANQLKHFVRACHQRGIAVLLDVVYNHYHSNAERAEWAYDSDHPERNIYYWYEGRDGDYPGDRPPGHGGYVDNQSTGYAPRYSEEMVRQLFISSAAAFAVEFHLDGFRVDQTTSIHDYGVIHADGRRADTANAFGAKFLRELSRTLKFIKPNIMLIAEDHSGKAEVTRHPDLGGMGFDATWYADFYHHLAGDTDKGSDYAKLIGTAGRGSDGPLAMGYFAGALSASGDHHVVYPESHDECGNSRGSGRTLAVAVNRAPLSGETRRYAEARSRFAFGMAFLSAGTPMFFMGEEIGATKDYRYNDFIEFREDLRGERAGQGARLFRFYQDLISLGRRHAVIRSRELTVLHAHDENRVLVFQRHLGSEEMLVLASLNNRPFASGYSIFDGRLPEASWSEVFNSDAGVYGGDDVGNGGATVSSSGGHFRAVIPANGFLVFRKM
jgi:1,4-alpha-glucan branching enzyme